MASDSQHFLNVFTVNYTVVLQFRQHHSSVGWNSIEDLPQIKVQASNKQQSGIATQIN